MREVAPVSVASTPPLAGDQVPMFDAPHGGARPPVAVITPVLNEEASIALVLRDIPRAWVRYVIVVDNGSTDGTARAARDGGAAVIDEPARGYGAACWRGLQALPDDVEYVAFLDGDYSDFPGELERLLAPLIAGEADLVIGSRTQGGAQRGSLFPQQRFGNWLATRLLLRCTGTRYSDLGPFRALTRAALDKLDMRDRGFGWTVEMQLKAPRKGLRIREVGVSYRPRVGRSKISGTVLGTIKAGWAILSTIWRYRREPRGATPL